MTSNANLNIHKRQPGETFETMLSEAVSAVNNAHFRLWRAANERADTHGGDDESYIFLMHRSGELVGLEDKLKKIADNDPD